MGDSIVERVEALCQELANTTKERDDAIQHRMELLDRYEEELGTLKVSIGEYGCEIAAVKAERDEAVGRAAQLEMELIGCTTKMNEAVQSATQMKAELDRYAAKIDEVIDNVGKMDENVYRDWKKLSTEITDLKKTINLLEAENDPLKHDLMEAKQQVQKLTVELEVAKLAKDFRKRALPEDFGEEERTSPEPPVFIPKKITGHFDEIDGDTYYNTEWMDGSTTKEPLSSFIMVTEAFKTYAVEKELDIPLLKDILDLE